MLIDAVHRIRDFDGQTPGTVHELAAKGSAILIKLIGIRTKRKCEEA